MMFLVLGCSSNQDNRSNTNPDLKKRGEEGKELACLFASGFKIRIENNTYELTIMDPWNRGEVMAVYSIERSKVPDRWAVSSTTHIGFLDALGEAGRVVGSTSPDRIYNEVLVGKFKNGDLVKIGSDMEFNFESVLGVEPDIVLQTAFEGQLQKDRKFLKTGLNFIYILLNFFYSCFPKSCLF